MFDIAQSIILIAINKRMCWFIVYFDPDHGEDFLFLSLAIKMHTCDHGLATIIHRQLIS